MYQVVMYRFAGKVGGWGILRNEGDPSNGSMVFKWGGGGVNIPFTDYVFIYSAFDQKYPFYETLEHRQIHITKTRW